MTTTASANGFADESKRSIPALAPYNKDYVDIMWSTSEAETVGAPIVCGEEDEYVLLPVLNKVNKLTSEKGGFVGSAELNEKVSENVSGAISGNTLVQPARTSIYAINIEDMSVITSRSFGEITTDCAIDGNLVYFGCSDGERYKFVCADISKSLETVWEYSSEKAITAPASYGNFVVFGAGNNLVIRTAMDGEFVENPVSADITNVLAGKYAIFMTCDDNTVKKVRLEDSGKVEADSLMSCETGGELTAPAEYNNHLYVGSSDGFFILDALNMEVISSYTSLKNSSAPLVCYGSGQRAYTVAWSKKEKRDVLYNVLDTDEEQTLSEVVKIIDFTNGHYTVSRNGVMYFRTADGKLWAISQSKINYFLIAIKIILTLAILVLLYLIFRAWLKKHGKNKPPAFLSGMNK